MNSLFYIKCLKQKKLNMKGNVDQFFITLVKLLINLMKLFNFNDDKILPYWRF